MEMSTLQPNITFLQKESTNSTFGLEFNLLKSTLSEGKCRRYSENNDETVELYLVDEIRIRMETISDKSLKLDRNVLAAANGLKIEFQDYFLISIQILWNKYNLFTDKNSNEKS